MSAKNKILIVDDEVKTCNILKKYFEGLFEVEVAYDGQQSIAKVEEFLPDCILLDFNMPVLDGLEVIKLIKPRHPDIEIIMMTAFEEIGLFAKCYLEGACGFIVKPIDLLKLEETILSVLERHSSS